MAVVPERQLFNEIETDQAGIFSLASGGGEYQSILVHLEFKGFDGAVSFSGKIIDAPALPLVELAYYNLSSGATVATALTADAIVVIPASKLETFVSVGIPTTGTLSIRYAAIRSAV